MVPKTNAIPLGGRKKKIERHVERLPEDAFSEVRPARYGGGRRPWEWACLDLAADPEKGMIPNPVEGCLEVMPPSGATSGSW